MGCKHDLSSTTAPALFGIFLQDHRRGSFEHDLTDVGFFPLLVSARLLHDEDAQLCRCGLRRVYMMLFVQLY